MNHYKHISHHFGNLLKAKIAAATLLLATSGIAAADGYYYRGIDSHAVIGGAVGGATGAAVGSMIGGRDGAIIGGGLGAAAGVAIATPRPAYSVGYPYHGHYHTYGHPGWGKYKFKHHGFKHHGYKGHRH